jgi:hypothetical protein
VFKGKHGDLNNK